MKKYIQFLDDFRKGFSEAIDKTIKQGHLENGQFLRIFYSYNKNNKDSFGYILNCLFGFDLDYSYINTLISNGELLLHKTDRDINSIIFDVIAEKRKNLSSYNYEYYTSSPFEGVLEYLGVFAANNYFTIEDGQVRIRNLIVTPETCTQKESELRKRTLHNFDAIMDKNGNTYLAVGFHDDLMLYMSANAIDMKEGIRIADEIINNKSVFELSSLYKYFRLYTDPENVDKDKCLYLSRSKIRKICEYIMTVRPGITKKALIDMFVHAEGFGYDFVSSSNLNEVNLDYYLALENLKNVMAILDELYPDDSAIDLVGMCKDRFKEMNNGIV